MVKLNAHRFVVEKLEQFIMDDKDIEEKIIQNACHLIEERLASMQNLRAYTYKGKQAFYDDREFNTYHLKDAFFVEYDGQNFDITNNKVVFGANGSSYNLFEMLWEGFGPYRVPTPTHHIAQKQPELFAYMTRTKKMESKLKFMNLSGKPMRYYYRYGGIMIKYALTRKGMSGELVNKFQVYIEDAIRQGVEDSVKEIIGDQYNQFSGEFGYT